MEAIEHVSVHDGGWDTILDAVESGQADAAIASIAMGMGRRGMSLSNSEPFEYVARLLGKGPQGVQMQTMGEVCAPPPPSSTPRPAPVRSQDVVAMMRAVAETTRGPAVKTLVSMDPLMVDGTGMCGGCRVKIGDQVIGMFDPDRNSQGLGGDARFAPSGFAHRRVTHCVRVLDQRFDAAE